MPKPTHVHVNQAIVTDQKFRPEDGKIYADERHEFQGSETGKAEEAEAIDEDSSITDVSANDKERSES